MGLLELAGMAGCSGRADDCQKAFIFGLKTRSPVSTLRKAFYTLSLARRYDWV